MPVHIVGILLTVRRVFSRKKFHKWLSKIPFRHLDHTEKKKKTEFLVWKLYFLYFLFLSNYLHLWQSSENHSHLSGTLWSNRQINSTHVYIQWNEMRNSFHTPTLNDGSYYRSARMDALPFITWVYVLFELPSLWRKPPVMKDGIHTACNSLKENLQSRLKHISTCFVWHHLDMV